MPFPAVERVIYQRNPLVEVICQVRFPAILRIDVEPPAAFQEVIRRDFPTFTETSGFEAPITLPPEMVNRMPGQLAEQLGALRMAINPGQKSYRFASEDDNWTILLSRDALSLSTKKYVRWEEFRGHLEPAITALVDQYAPSSFSRVGLRYQDLICRTELGLQDVTWSDLLAPHIAGELGTEIGSEVKHAARQLIVSLPELSGQVLLQHGIAQRVGGDGENCFVIDCDFYSEERTEVSDVRGLLEGLHGQAGRLFRWCIQQRLHEALDPRPVAD